MCIVDTVCIKLSSLKENLVANFIKQQIELGIVNFNLKMATVSAQICLAYTSNL